MKEPLGKAGWRAGILKTGILKTGILKTGILKTGINSMGIRGGSEQNARKYGVAEDPHPWT